MENISVDGQSNSIKILDPSYNENLVRVLNSFVWVTCGIFLLLLIQFIFFELVWPAWFTTHLHQTIDLKKLGDMGGQIHLEWPAVIPYEQDSILTINYIPGSNSSQDFDIAFATNSPNLQFATPAGSAPSQQSRIKFKAGNKRQAAASLENLPNGLNINPFFPGAQIFWIVSNNENGKTIINSNSDFLSVSLETPIVSILRKRISGIIGGSQLVLIISALLPIGLKIISARYDQKEAIKNQQVTMLFQQVRECLKNSDLNGANKLLEDPALKEIAENNINANLANKLIAFPTCDFESAKQLINFPEGWGDETAGALVAAALQAQNTTSSIPNQDETSLSEEQNNQQEKKCLSELELTLLLRSFPLQRASQSARAKIDKKLEELGANHPSRDRVWPLLPDRTSIEKSEAIFMEEVPFQNPFVADRAEVDEDHLYCKFDGLYWKDHPIYRSLNETRLKGPITCVIGEKGSGKTVLAKALTTYAADENMFGVYLAGSPNRADIRTAFSQRMLEFLTENPTHFYHRENTRYQALAELLIGCLGKFPIVSQINNKIDQLEEQNEDCLPDLVQLNLFLDAVERSTPITMTDTEWLFTLVELSRRLNFKRFRLALDTDPATNINWFLEIVAGLRSTFTATRIQVFLMLPKTVYCNWVDQSLCIENYNIPIRWLNWKDKQRDLLDEMLEYRWGIYNKNIHLFEIPSLCNVYQETLRNHPDNPAEFISAWRQRLRLDQS